MYEMLQTLVRFRTVEEYVRFMFTLETEVSKRSAKYAPAPFVCGVHVNEKRSLLFPGPRIHKLFVQRGSWILKQFIVETLSQSIFFKGQADRHSSNSLMRKTGYSKPLCTYYSKTSFFLRILRYDLVMKRYFLCILIFMISTIVLEGTAMGVFEENESLPKCSLVESGTRIKSKSDFSYFRICFFSVVCMTSVTMRFSVPSIPMTK